MKNRKFRHGNRGAGSLVPGAFRIDSRGESITFTDASAAAAALFSPHHPEPEPPTPMSVLVGKPAPSFNAKAVVNGQVVDAFSLDQYRGKQYVIFFFYPKELPWCVI